MTTSQTHTPRLDADAFDCPVCDAYSNQLWSPAYVMQRGQGAVQVVGEDGNWAISQCARCRQYSVWLGLQLIYPANLVGPIAPDDMPAEVRSLYDEARRVASVSRRAGAAMARATLELLVKSIDLDAPQRATLADRLDRVIPTVDASLGKLLTFVRHVGNTIHVPEDADDAVVMVLDEDQTAGMELIFQAINGLVEEKITRPRMADEVYELIPEGVRNRVEKATKG